MNNKTILIASIVGLVLFVVGSLIGSGAKLGHCECCPCCKAVGVYWQTDCDCVPSHKPCPTPKPTKPTGDVGGIL